MIKDLHPEYTKETVAKQRNLTFQFKKQAKDLNGHFTKEGMWEPNSTWKDAQYYLSIGGYTWKPQWEATHSVSLNDC